MGQERVEKLGRFTNLTSGELSQESLSLSGGHLEGGDLDGDASILGGDQGLEGTGVSGVGVEDLDQRQSKLQVSSASIEIAGNDWYNSDEPKRCKVMRT